MIFKYGSFFGMSAIHAMFLRVNDVDRIFKNINMKTSTISIMRNLYIECTALREIFSQQSKVEGIPHVIMKRDTSSPKVEYLLNGLNNFINSKSATQEINEIAVTDIESLDDFDDLADTTSFFTENSDIVDEVESLDNFDDLAEDIDDAASINLSDIFNYTDTEDIEAITEQYSYEDLIAWGKAQTPETKTVTEYSGLARYMIAHRKDFSPEEYDSITKQIADLPFIPVGIKLPHTVPQSNPNLSATSLRFLQVIYTQMMREVEGVNFIDFFCSRLAMLITSSEAHDKQIFFTSTADFTRDKTIRSSNTFICNLQEQYLKKGNLNAIKSHINVLLTNCREALGLEDDSELTNTLNEARTFADRWIASPGEITYDMRSSYTDLLMYISDTKSMSDEEQVELINLTSYLVESEQISTLLNNPDNIKLLFNLYTTMYNVICKEMFIKLGLNEFLSEHEGLATLEDIQFYCTKIFREFTQETGICGLYAQYKDLFYQTLRNIQTPLAVHKNILFSPASVNYRMASLLYKHLQSLKIRLGEGA